MSSLGDESSPIQVTAKKLEKLHTIERDIIKMLGLAAGAIEELSKESPSSEAVEYKTKDFVKTLEGYHFTEASPLSGRLGTGHCPFIEVQNLGIEKGLSDEIQYLNQVSTTQAHEGSVYGIEKDYELSLLQTSVVRDYLKTFVEPEGSKPSHEPVTMDVTMDTNTIDSICAD